MRLLTEDEVTELLMKTFYKRNGRQLNLDNPNPEDEGALEALGGLLNSMGRGKLEAYFEDGRVRVRSTVKN
jgi:hypothetical protein